MTAEYHIPHLKSCKNQKSKIDPLVETGCHTHPKLKRELSLDNVNDTTTGCSAPARRVQRTPSG